MATTIRIEALGELRISGATFPIPQGRAQVVHALFALKETYPRQDLVDVLWWGDDIEDADDMARRRINNKLDQILGQARKPLGNHGSQLLFSLKGQVRLPRGIQERAAGINVEVDVDDFRRLVAEDDEDTLRRALLLIRGPFAQSLTAPGTRLDFVEEARHRTRDTIIGVLHRLKPDSEHTEALADDVLAGKAGEVLAQLPARKRIGQKVPQISSSAASDNRYVSGSRRVRVRDLVTNPDLLMPFPWRREGHNHDEPDDLLDVLADGIRAGSRYLVLSGPGFGKSVLTHALEHRLNSSGSIQRAVRLDLYDHRNQLGDADFGTKEWLTSELSSDLNDQPILLLDALDEYLAGSRQEDIMCELDRNIFASCNLLTCRTTFYRQHVTLTRLVERFSVITLSAWSDIELGRYITGYYRFLASSPGDSLKTKDEAKAVARATDFIKQPAIRGLCTSPLRISMALDQIEPDGPNLDPSISTALQFYASFTTKVLSRESAKPGTVLTAEEKHHILEEIAWKFYDDTTASSGQEAGGFTSGELARFLRGLSLAGQADALLKEIEDRSLLDRVAREGLSPSRDLLAFAHKTIQDYFVACRLFRCLDESADDAALMFLRLGSPAVSEFYKEHIGLTKALSTSVLNRMNDRCLAAITALEQLQPSGQQEAGRARLAIGQLLYYIGVIGAPSGVNYLKRREQHETDPWLRRSIVVGLSFTGDLSFLSKYASDLRDERRRGTSTLLNDQNLGFHFSFFGDQPLDPEAPDHDQGLERCEQTVTSLIYQLSREVTSATWMIDLYTLMDLWRNVPWAASTVESVAVEHFASLRTSWRRLSTNPNRQEWPELQDLEELISAIDSKGASGAIQA